MASVMYRIISRLEADSARDWRNASSSDANLAAFSDSVSSSTTTISRTGAMVLDPDPATGPEAAGGVVGGEEEEEVGLRD